MPGFNLLCTTSLHALPLAAAAADEPELGQLEELVEYAARLLPAEGPISGFTFLNPLHAFEGMRFEDAARAGTRLFGSRCYLPEERYRKELARDRIQVVDLRSILEADDKAKPWALVGGLVSRLDLRLQMLLTPMAVASDDAIGFAFAEQRMLDKFLPIAAQPTRARVVEDAKRWAVRDLFNREPESGHVLRPLLAVLRPLLKTGGQATTVRLEDAVWEGFALRALWEVCLAGVRAADARPPRAERPARPRDAVRAATGVDPDRLVHDLLIRFCAAFCDQGQAAATLPDRDAGFLKTFARLYGGRRRWGTPKWLRGLPELLERAEAVGAVASIRESLDDLGVGRDEYEAFLPATMVALRGWGSMIRQMEVRADRFPNPALRGTLLEFFAVRLILDRLALAHVAREELGHRGPVAGVRAAAERVCPPAAGPSDRQAAFVAFQLAQSLGWRPSFLHGMSAAEWGELLAEIRAFDQTAREEVFHQAYERRYAVRALDAVAARAAQPHRKPAAPRFQAAFCIDTREESFARHLEEAAPEVETFGLPGFFCAPMYYKGVADAHPVASCPIIVRPQNWVEEEVLYHHKEYHRRTARWRRWLGLTSRGFTRGSRGLGAGAVASAGVGVLASVPLVGRVLFPRLAAKITRAAARLVSPPDGTRLTAHRTAPVCGPAGDQLGFSPDERANLADKVLRFIGLTRGFSRLVLLLGHGSDGVNNPHLSAYNCGACSGNTGGPNARLMAAFLNDPQVREALARLGIAVPATTYFQAGQHNTGDDTFTFYDLDVLPRTHWADLDAARASLADAAGRNARERCRRFESAPLSITEPQALAHVHGRTVDLAQVRPEFGNGTNAMCIVGRRSRIRGLFLDRRAFFHSYDPTQDDAAGGTLARILAPTVPVCQGINLEYYFSAVDPAGWGAGTKLPHNVTGLIGVMDGAASDLRQGLPWQGVEIHEPVRILFLIETTPEVMTRIMDADDWVGRIFRNGWAQLAVLDPHSAEVRVFEKGKFELYHPTGKALPRVKESAEWYTGQRDHLGFAEVNTGAGADNW